jgi:anti-anti-sigma regulatory factor
VLKRTGAHGGWLRLARMPENVDRVFRATGLYRVFEVFGTVEAAIAHETERITL